MLRWLGVSECTPWGAVASPASPALHLVLQPGGAHRLVHPGAGHRQEASHTWHARSLRLVCAPPAGLIGHLIWLLCALLVGFLDWPLRRLTAGRLPGVRLARSSRLSYDEQLAAALWDASADAAGVPRECRV